MRIVYVLTSLGVGGVERQVLALAGRMAQRGHTVLLIVLVPVQQDGLRTTLDVVHLNLRKSPLRVVMGLWKGWKLLRRFHPDLVHSHNFHGNMLARLLEITLPRAPIISTIHNVYEGGWSRMLAYRLTDRFSGCSVAVSTAAAERYIRLKAVPAAKCMVLSNAIDLAEFTADALRRAKTRSEFEVAEEFIWFAAGRIVPAKDFPNLLRAFALVREIHPSAQLWIAGKLSDGGTNPGIEFDSKKTNGIRWFGQRRDMPALLDAADAFVLSSAREGMPLVVGEAMAMQKPIVATDVGGVRELVGEFGTVVPARDSAVSAKAMLTLMATPRDERQAQGRAARGRIVSTFSFEKRMNEWKTLYDTVLQRSL